MAGLSGHFLRFDPLSSVRQPGEEMKKVFYSKDRGEVYFGFHRVRCRLLSHVLTQVTEISPPAPFRLLKGIGSAGTPILFLKSKSLPSCRSRSARPHPLVSSTSSLDPWLGQVLHHASYVLLKFTVSDLSISISSYFSHRQSDP